MHERVEFYRHQVGEDEIAAWQKVVGSLFLTLGPQVAAFEDDLVTFLRRGRTDVGPRYAIGTNSCSMALVVALAALGVQPDDEIITTPMTFVATCNAILHLGARPIFCDVEPDTGLIDPAAVRAAIGPRTRGILPVHLYGQLADMRALRDLADRHGLFIVEDAAHGIEMERDGVRPGDLGNAATFSFYATKNITSGDGGAIFTRDAALAERMRRLRNHGITKSASDRHSDEYQHWDMVELGFKANLTDLDAALLRAQLPKVLAKRDTRQKLVERYESLIAARFGSRVEPSHRGVPLVVRRRGTSSHHLFTVHAPETNRDDVLTNLGRRGIGTAVNYRAIHTLTYLREKLRTPLGALPVAEEIGARTLSLPLYPTLSESDQDRVIEALVAAWPDSP
jgi:UDP-4-amino-4-deoxy-L-arabinose-oxoglutarate aminotransferase